jgi:hypothetical protein
MDLSRLRDPKVMIVAGAGGLALLAALGIGIGAVVRAGHHEDIPASAELSDSSGPTSLHVEMGTGDPGLDLARPLRCFVGGQFVGMLTLKECAQRNGISPGQLDVGIDTSGEVAAASSSAAVLQPLPSAPTPPPAALPQPAQAPSAPAATPEAAASPGAGSACWRYVGEWRKISEDMSLDACVQALFAGKCARPGSADYGRWADTTLRLVTGKVERQGSGGGFRTLVRQPAGECTIPHIEE